MRSCLFPLLATAVLSQASGATNSHATTKYSLTNAVIPSDQSVSKRAVGNWDDAYTKATAALAKLSQSEKIGIVTGVGWQKGPCVGNTKAAGSIGYPSLCLQGEQL
jgi:beta-glucosidase